MSLAFEQVSFSYDNKAPVLADVDFELADGEALGVCGPVGSGKSTLLRLAALLERPDRGRVLVDGHVASDQAKRHGRGLLEQGHIGVLFQFPERQLFCPTVREDVSFGPRNLGLAAQEVHKRVLSALELCGFDAYDILDASPFELSGGEARRVAVAGVLALEPRILVLDEPTAGLDPAARRKFLTLIQTIREERKTTVLFATHNMDDLARLADHALLLDGLGAALLEETRAALSDEERLRTMGLEAPFAPRFAARLATRGFQFDRTPLTTEELACALADKR